MAIASCKKCTKEFKIKPSTRGLFCSLVCYHLSMAGVAKPFTGKSAGGWNKGIKGLNTGEKHGRWISDRSLIKVDTDNERGGPLHKQWSQSVKNRDCWKCKMSNGDCSGQVVAHHILPWRDYVELRYEVNNGITLCHFHHPRKRNDEMILSPFFQELVGVKVS